MKSHKLTTLPEDENVNIAVPDINQPGVTDWACIQPCFGHHFFMIVTKLMTFDGHRQFFAAVQLIGSRKQAENFAYKLELKGQGRRVTWEATTTSIREGNSSAITNSDCLVLNASTAQLLADKGELSFKLSISTV
jgi:hypothetical protein